MSASGFPGKRDEANRLLAEPVEDGGVSGIGLGGELRRRLVVVLFPPVDRDLGFGDLGLRIIRHN